MNRLAPVLFTVAATESGFARSASTLSYPRFGSCLGVSPGMDFCGSRIGRMTSAPCCRAYRAAAEPTLPVRPNIMVLIRVIIITTSRTESLLRILLSHYRIYLPEPATFRSIAGMGRNGSERVGTGRKFSPRCMLIILIKTC